MNKQYDIVIIGAGASGLLASIHAAELGAKVLVLEKMDRAACKLAITGKGRCNITNNGNIKDFIANIYPDGRFLYSAFKSFFNEDIITLLNDLGIETVLERGGRFFPKSGKAIDIVNALLNKALKLNVDFIYKANVKKIITENKKIIAVKYLKKSHENIINTNNVIIATGGKSYPLTGSTGDGYTLAKNLGHTIVQPLPALVALETVEKFTAEFNNLTLKNVNATLLINGKPLKEEFGELQFTDFGLSGPIILTLSRWSVEELEKNSKVEINIDFKPALSEEKLNKRLLRDIDDNGKTTIEKLFKLWLPVDAISVFLKQLKLDRQKFANQLSGTERKDILNLLKNFKFTIKQHRGFDSAIITNGGISTDEIDPKTMQSKLISGLYFAGEVINLDANTGGYNLQIAFSTAWLAAENCF